MLPRMGEVRVRLILVSRLRCRLAVEPVMDFDGFLKVDNVSWC